MKQNLIFITFLLATLVLMIDAIPHRLYKRQESVFTQCDGDFPNPLDATISPVPIVFGETVNVTVNGTVPSTPIEDNSKLELKVADVFDDDEPFCSDEVVCPVTTDYVVSQIFTLPPTNDITEPVEVRIQILDPEGKAYSCVRGTVDVGPPSEVPPKAPPSITEVPPEPTEEHYG